MEILENATKRLDKAGIAEAGNDAWLLFSEAFGMTRTDYLIDKNAECTVETIDANSIVICGNVKGDMNAGERVEICSGSVVEGNIKTSRIRIANNVDFSGEVSMIEKEPEVDLFSVASSEYKQAMVIHSDVVK